MSWPIFQTEYRYFEHVCVWITCPQPLDNVLTFACGSRQARPSIGEALIRCLCRWCGCVSVDNKAFVLWGHATAQAANSNYEISSSLFSFVIVFCRDWTEQYSDAITTCNCSWNRHQYLLPRWKMWETWSVLIYQQQYQIFLLRTEKGIHLIQFSLLFEL